MSAEGRQCATHILAILPNLTIKLQVPSEGTLEELLIVFVVHIQLPVVVTLPIRRTINNSLDILTPEDQCTRNDRCIGLSEDTH